MYLLFILLMVLATIYLGFLKITESIGTDDLQTYAAIMAIATLGLAVHTIFVDLTPWK